MNFFTASLCALMLSACSTTAAMSSAPIGVFEVEGGASVHLTESWTHIPSDIHIWEGAVLTKDGMGLNRVHIVQVKPGKSMLTLLEPSLEYPVFEGGRSELKQIEFVISSLTRSGVSGLIPNNIRPITLGEANGVAFDFDGKYGNGLNMKGKVALAESAGGLSIIAFIAPAAHYFSKDAASVDRMISTYRSNDG